ncbi:MAG: c-type cytochrome [Acidobacteriota bacterium]
MRFTRVVAYAVLALVVAGGGWLYWFLAAHGFSAREKPSRLEALLARHARRIATPHGAGELKNLLEPTLLNVAEGRDHFADHCAICHANDGAGRTQINAGLYPPAPDMRQPGTQELADGEIFYIIKNGIRFTGMPGWGGADEENWKLVLFIRRLPKLTPKELDLMKEINRLELETDSGGNK